MTAVVVPLGPAEVNITGVRAGDRNTITVRILSGGVPLDLTGMTVSSQVRKAAIDADPPSIEAECTVTDGPGGVASIHWPGDDVRGVLAGAANWAGVWDVQIAAGAADPVTIAAGTWQADMDVTR